MWTSRHVLGTWYQRANRSRRQPLPGRPCLSPLQYKSARGVKDVRVVAADEDEANLLLVAIATNLGRLGNSAALSRVSPPPRTAPAAAAPLNDSNMASSSSKISGPGNQLNQQQPVRGQQQVHQQPQQRERGQQQVHQQPQQPERGQQQVHQQPQQPEWGQQQVLQQQMNQPQQLNTPPPQQRRTNSFLSNMDAAASFAAPGQPRREVVSRVLTAADLAAQQRSAAEELPATAEGEAAMMAPAAAFALPRPGGGSTRPGQPRQRGDVLGLGIQRTMPANSSAGPQGDEDEDDDEFTDMAAAAEGDRPAAASAPAAAAPPRRYVEEEEEGVEEQEVDVDVSDVPPAPAASRTPTLGSVFKTAPPALAATEPATLASTAGRGGPGGPAPVNVAPTAQPEASTSATAREPATDAAPTVAAASAQPPTQAAPTVSAGLMAASTSAPLQQQPSPIASAPLPKEPPAPATQPAAPPTQQPQKPEVQPPPPQRPEVPPPPPQQQPEVPFVSGRGPVLSLSTLGQPSVLPRETDLGLPPSLLKLDLRALEPIRALLQLPKVKGPSLSSFLFTASLPLAALLSAARLLAYQVCRLNRPLLPLPLCFTPAQGQILSQNTRLQVEPGAQNRRAAMAAEDQQKIAFLEDLVRRLSEQLARASHLGPAAAAAAGTEPPVGEGPLPAWAAEQRHLSPLLAAYDGIVAEQEAALQEAAAGLQRLGDQVAEVAAENEALQAQLRSRVEEAAAQILSGPSVKAEVHSRIPAAAQMLERMELLTQENDLLTQQARVLEGEVSRLNRELDMRETMRRDVEREVRCRGSRGKDIPACLTPLYPPLQAAEISKQKTTMASLQAKVKLLKDREVALENELETNRVRA